MAFLLYIGLTNKKVTNRVIRNRGLDITTGRGEAALIEGGAPVLVTVLAVTLVGVEGLPGEEGGVATNGDASDDSWRGPYSDGTTTTTLSKSRKVWTL